MRSIAGLFGRSPFIPLQEHSVKVTTCVKLIKPLFEALVAGETDKVGSLVEEIGQAEHEADKVKNDVRSHLPKSLFLPVARRDLLDVLSIQDSIADVAQDVAEFLTLRPMKVPNDLADDLLKFVDQVINVAEKSTEIVQQFDELLEASFGGLEARRVMEMIDDLGSAEHETDVTGKVLAQKIFAMEDRLDPVSVMTWSHLLETIGDIANRSEKMGNQLRLLIAT